MKNFSHFLNILCNSAYYNKKPRRKPQFFFTPVYSSTVFVVMVVTGLPCLSGAVLYVAVVEIVRQALQPLRATAAAIKINKNTFFIQWIFYLSKMFQNVPKKYLLGILGLFWVFLD